MEQVLKDNDALGSLFSAILLLKDVDECASFFRDLCTVSELKALAERWHVVQMLAQDLPYRKIRGITGASTATITRIAHWYRYGEGGYRLLIERTGEKRAESHT
jgi:TrpR-related protein YerC/YecD